MTYARIDDNHAEALALLSDKAFRVHFRGRLYCARMLSDGRVPKRTAEEWGRKAVAELLAAEFWAAEGDHYIIPSHLGDGNPTRAQVDERRRLDSDRKRNGFQAESTPESEQTPRARSRTPTPAPTPRSAPAPEVQDQIPRRAASEPENEQAFLAHILRDDIARQTGKTPEEVEAEFEAATKPRGKHPYLHIDDHQQGILHRLWAARPGWESQLSHSALVRLMKDHGVRAVNDALEDLIEHAGQVERPYPYLAKIAAESHSVANQ